MLVADIMTREVRTVTPDTPLKEAARLMAEAGVSGLPVLEGEHLVGIITEADFVAPPDDGRRSRHLLAILFGGERRIREATTVGEAMTREVVTIGPDRPVREAARTMARLGVKRLPVVDGDGHLVGIVSRADVLRTYARDDAEIAADVGATFDALPIPLDPDRIAISVEEGVVTLSGTVETNADAEVLERVARAVDGVVAVRGRLDCEVDLDRVGRRWPHFGEEEPD